MKLNPKGFFTAKDLGTVSNARPSSTDDLMLDDIDFVIGDYIDVAIRRDHGRTSHCCKLLHRVLNNEAHR